MKSKLVVVVSLGLTTQLLVSGRLPSSAVSLAPHASVAQVSLIQSPSLTTVTRPNTQFDVIWEPNEKLSGGYVYHPSASIAVDDSGNAVVVWEQHESTDDVKQDCYISVRSHEGNWTQPVPVESALDYCHDPDVALDQAGNIHLVWKGTWEIFYSSLPAGSLIWTPTVTIADYQDSWKYQPAVATDTQGNTYAVWLDNRDGTGFPDFDVYFSKKPQIGTWGANEKVNSGASIGCSRHYFCNCESPDIALDDYGTPHVAWAQNRDIHYSYRTTDGWQAKEMVNDVDGSAFKHTSLAVDEFGNVFVVWPDDRDGNLDIYFALRPVGGTWGIDQLVSDDVGTSIQCYPAISVNRAGDAVAVWSDGRNENYIPGCQNCLDLYSSSRPAESMWGPNTRVNDYPGEVGYTSPAVTIDSVGVSYAVWEDERDRWQGDIFFSTAGNPAQRDTDGDALLDSWETYGLSRVVDGVTYYLDLPAMGADPQRKDIFVEIDYMVEQGFCHPWMGCVFGHSHRPKPEAVAKVVEAFANAPVPNPDGSTGIILHVDHGPESVMNPLTGEKWGNLSRSDPLPHVDWLGSMTGNEYDWSDFDMTKAENFSPARVPAFHYSVFAHYAPYKEVGLLRFPYSGVTRGIPASDFIVSLADWPVDGGRGTVNEQAGTFMHELGHNLGLRHGGDDHTNYEPNFLSVMNYSFQTHGLIVNGQEGYYDYSRFALPNLDESNLDETVGLDGGTVITNYGTRYYCATGGDKVVYNANGTIDWNCNDNSTETNVQTDVNKDSSVGTLGSYNDWVKLIYTGGVIGVSGPAPSLPATTAVQGITRDEDAELTTLYKVAVTALGNTAVLAGSTVEYRFILANLGDNQDIYTLVVSSTKGWADTSSVPISITLSEGVSEEFLVTVNVPSSAGSGVKDELVFSAVSQASPRIEDSAIAVTSVIYQLFLPIVTKDH